MTIPPPGEPRLVVGLDFGATFSGFAYALTSEPDKVHNFYAWPGEQAAGGPGHYSKTSTSLLYRSGDSAGSFVLQDWGYSALVEYAKGMNSTWGETVDLAEDVLCIANQLSQAVPINSKTASHFLTLFKLHLFGAKSGQTLAAELPEGLTLRRVVSDYLQKMSQFIGTILRKKLGSFTSMQDVQWCLTVPANWGDEEKQEMKICASMAGMVQGLECPPGYKDSASPHPVIIVTEPEAASLYCQKKLQSRLRMKNGDKSMIVDIGGETMNLVVQEKVSAVKVREVSPSCTGLIGGSAVDKAFFDFLSRKITCFQEFALTNPESLMKLKGSWETLKCKFDGTMTAPYQLELPAGLALAWQEAECSKKPDVRRRSTNIFSRLGLSWFSKEDDERNYDAIELSLRDMLSLFDPVVNGILKYIKSKMVKGVKLEAMLIVGGFSSSPYVFKRIRKQFSARVGKVLVPEHPGSAISCGAVLYGLSAPGELLRISKKTYGIKVAQRSCDTDPLELRYDVDGVSYCTKFSVYAKKNDEIPLDHAVSHTVFPLKKDQTTVAISLLSTLDSNPQYPSDPGVETEGTFKITCPSNIQSGKWAEILISIYFRRTFIEVEAKGLNFGNGEIFKMAKSVRFEGSFK